MFFYGTLTVKDLIGTHVGHAVLATGSVTWCTLLAMFGTWRVMCLTHSSSDSSCSWLGSSFFKSPDSSGVTVFVSLSSVFAFGAIVNSSA